jgi:hypothetical protein
MQMLNTMAGEGQLGSPRAGYSGSAQGALGKLYGQAGKEVGLQAWNMINPNQMEAWRMPYSLAAASLGGTLPTNVYSPDTTGAQQAQLFGTLASMMAMGAMASSDIRLKRNVRKIGKYRGLDIIRFNYVWSDKEYVGLIAQQVRETFPEAVVEIGGYLAVNYGIL